MPLVIPFLQRPLLRFPAQRGRGRGDEGEQANRAIRILVAEDEYIVGLDLENKLIMTGFDVIGVASSATEAFKIAASKKPDLAILDINLSGKGDGIDAAIQLYDRLAIRSIFVTAFGDEETRRRAAPARPIGWLVKPYSWESLYALLEKARREDEQRN